MKSKFNPNQPFTCTCPDTFQGKNDLIFFFGGTCSQWKRLTDIIYV